MPVNKLMILAADAAKYRSLIQAAGLHQLEIRTAVEIGAAKKSVTGCNIILGDPPLVSELISFAGDLEWLQSSWAGVDQLCKPGLRRDYVLTGAKDIFGPLISEYVMAYLFGLERRVFPMRSNQLKKSWRPLVYRPSSQLTLGIAGLGSIGRHLATTARHFGIRVIGFNRSGRNCEDVEKVFTADSAEEFFKQSDYLVLTLPDTPWTRNFINTEVLNMMKPSAVLMNVGRGSLVNEAALVRALQAGVIDAAVLDVFAKEPLSGDSPLWSLPNVYVTPHMAATSFADDIAGIFIDNYQRYTNGKPLRHVIDFALGY